jgi:hypothetical protein
MHVDCTDWNTLEHISQICAKSDAFMTSSTNPQMIDPSGPLFCRATVRCEADMPCKVDASSQQGKGGIDWAICAARLALVHVEAGLALCS